MQFPNDLMMLLVLTTPQFRGIISASHFLIVTADGPGFDSLNVQLTFLELFGDLIDLGCILKYMLTNVRL